MDIPEQINGRIGYNCGVHFEDWKAENTVGDAFFKHWEQIRKRIALHAVMGEEYKHLKKFGYPGIFVSTTELPITPDDGLKIETVKTRNGDLTVYMRLER